MRTLLSVYCVLFSYHATVITGSIAGLVNLEIDLIQFTNPSGINIHQQQCQHGSNCTLGDYGFQYCIEDQNSGLTTIKNKCGTGWNDIGFVPTNNNTIDFSRDSGNWHNPLLIREENLQFYQLKFHFYVSEITTSGSPRTDITFLVVKFDADSTVLGTVSVLNLSDGQNPNARLSLNVSLICADKQPLGNNMCHMAPHYNEQSNIELYLIDYNNPTGTLYHPGYNCSLGAAECNIGITTCYETYDQMTLPLMKCAGPSVVYRSITNQSNSIDFLNSTQCFNNSQTVNCTEFDNPLHYVVKDFTAIRLKITVHHYATPSSQGQLIDNFVFDVWALDHQINSSYLLHLTGNRQENPTKYLTAGNCAELHLQYAGWDFYSLVVAIALCSGSECDLPIPSLSATSTQIAPSSASSVTTTITETTTTIASLTRTTSESTGTASSSSSAPSCTPSICEGRSNGNYNDPSNACTQYFFMCSNSLCYAMDCPVGFDGKLYFDSITQGCVEKENVLTCK